MQYRFDSDGMRRRMMLAGYASADARALAEVVGVTDTAIRNYLNGKRMPAGNHLARLARVLGCDVWDLLTPIEKPVAS